MPRKAKVTTHYVDNAKLHAELLSYHYKRIEAEKNGTQKPRIPNYVGEACLKIGEHLFTKPNFSRYSYKDDMISDGLENCVKYIDNFDPIKYKNPFAYFTKIIFFAFLRRIEREKKEQYVKHKVLENDYIFANLVEQQNGNDKNVDPAYINIDDAYAVELVTSYEDRIKQKRKKQKDNNLKKQLLLLNKEANSTTEEEIS